MFLLHFNYMGQGPLIVHSPGFLGLFRLHAHRLFGLSTSHPVVFGCPEGIGKAPGLAGRRF